MPMDAFHIRYRSFINGPFVFDIIFVAEPFEEFHIKILPPDA
jgi:hypothetical protein